MRAINLSQGRRFGLQWELIATLVLLLVATLFFGGFLVLGFFEQKAVERHLKMLLLLSSTVAQEQMSDGNLQPKLGPLWKLQDDAHAEAWWLYDADLQLIASSSYTGQAPTSAKLEHFKHLTRSWFDLRWSSFPSFTTHIANNASIAVPLHRNKNFKGVLVADFSLSPLFEDVATARGWILIFSASYALVLALVSYWLLRRNVIQPIKRLLGAIEKVTDGNYVSSVSVEGPREVARLADRFNRMVDALYVSRDKTDRTIASLQEANRSVAKTREELIHSEKLASIGHLAAGMAHEVGNPLSAIIGYLDLLQREIPEGSLRPLVDLSLKETERIDQIVRDLLDYASSGSSQIEVIPPWDVVVEAVDLLHIQGAFKQIKLDLDRDVMLPQVQMDRAKLMQVLINILLNSRDAVGDVGQITLRGYADDSQIHINIEDNGQGMSSEVKEQLFEPFFTTKDPGKGRGLGLSICQRIMEEANGRIDVSSVQGEGTIMTVVFPRYETDYDTSES